jgi:hypothetical protein
MFGENIFALLSPWEDPKAACLKRLKSRVVHGLKPNLISAFPQDFVA